MKVSRRKYYSKPGIYQRTIAISLRLISILFIPLLPVTCQEVSDTSSLNYQLIEAAHDGDAVKIVKLLNEGASINTTSWGGVTPLMYAVDGGHYDAVQTLVLNGADVNIIPENKMTALFSAVYGNQPAIADLLLQYGASLDISDDRSVTPLMVAVSYNEAEITDLLLYYGASTEKKDSQGNTSLMLAALAGNIQIADMLLSAGASTRERNKQGFTPLMCAAQNGDTAMISLLLKNGSELNEASTSGYTALSLAIMHNQVAAVTMLLEMGADPNLKTSASQSIGQLARISGNKEIISLIREYGAKDPYKPDLSVFPVGFVQSLNMQDFYTGFYVGTQDRRTKITLEAGFSARPTSKRILVKTELPDIYYQFREYRYMVFIRTGKIFPFLTLNQNSKLAVSANFAGIFTWGNYRGSSRTPIEKVMFVPEIGLGYYKKSLGINMSYGRLTLDQYKISDGRLSLGLGWLIDALPRRNNTIQVSWW